MERHDDAEQHQGARGDEPDKSDYPRGRGYGQDYMRGGEVFGGYGYSERPEYDRPLADQQRQEHAAGQEDGKPGNDAPPADERQFIQELETIERGTASSPSSSPTGAVRSPARAPANPDPLTTQLPPAPQVEGSFGNEGQQNYSRSYYVTQAQLQQRLYKPGEERHTPGPPADLEE